eukprot:UN22034
MRHSNIFFVHPQDFKTYIADFLWHRAPDKRTCFLFSISPKLTLCHIYAVRIMMKR